MFAAVLEAGDAVAAGGGGNLRILEDMIRQAQQRGEIRQGDPGLLARIVWALVHGASMPIGGNEAEPCFIRFSAEVLRSGLIDRQMPDGSPQSRVQDHGAVA
jgi:hypothetical protein